jgi:two-component system OmpR family response regulator
VTNDRLRIVIVEDERAMREMLVLALEREGYEIRALGSGAGLAQLIRTWNADLVILDIGLPGADGIALVPLVRACCDAPILMLTARSETSDKVRALTAGADHYVTKPVELDELLARIGAALRRPALAGVRTALAFRDLELDVDAHEVRSRGTLVDLTPREFSLLEVLIRTPGRAFSKSELLEHVWGLDHEGDWSIVDRYISYLRTKLEASGAPRLVATVRGIGYALRSSEDA